MIGTILLGLSVTFGVLALVCLAVALYQLAKEPK